MFAIERKQWICSIAVLLSIMEILFCNVNAIAHNSKDKNVLDMGVVTVTAPGSEQKVEDVQATVQIISGDDIKSFSGRSLSQIVAHATGLFVTDSGTSSSISIRGFEDGHALILVDGMRRTGKYGSADLNGIQQEDIERIEIVRGPMSALYGADAMSGVVNIVTRKAAEEKSFSGKLIGGIAGNDDRETAILRATGNLGASGKTNHRLSTEVKHRGEYRLEDDQPYTSLSEEHRYFLSYAGDYAVNDNQFMRWRAEFTHQDDDGISSSSSLNHPRTYEKEDRLQMGLQYHLFGPKNTFDLNIGYGNADTESDRTSGPEHTDYAQYEANGVWTQFFTNDHHLISAGAGARREEIELTILTERPERDNYYSFLQDQWQIAGNVTLVGGIRYDHYNDFGESVNPKLSLSWNPGGYYLRGGYGTAFRAPAFTSMYSYFERSSGRSISIIYGNPDLEAEESETYEAAIGYRGKRLRLEGAYHYNKLKNLVDAELTGVSADPSGARIANYEYVNVSKAEISGVELILSADISGNWQFSASHEYLDKKDDDTDERLTGYARNTTKTGTSFKMDSFSVHAYYRWIRDFYNSDPNLPRGSDPVDSDFSMMDIKVEYHLFTHHTLSLGVDNLFDEETPANYTRGGSPLDPGERYYYLEYAFTY